MNLPFANMKTRDTSMFDARPHPGPNLGLAPLPRGEGEIVSASWQYACGEFALVRGFNARDFRGNLSPAEVEPRPGNRLGISSADSAKRGEGYLRTATTLPAYCHGQAVILQTGTLGNLSDAHARHLSMSLKLCFLNFRWSLLTSAATVRGPDSRLLGPLLLDP